jgi:hypothetical protein
MSPCGGIQLLKSRSKSSSRIGGLAKTGKGRLDNCFTTDGEKSSPMVMWAMGAMMDWKAVVGHIEKYLEHESRLGHNGAGV